MTATDDEASKFADDVEQWLMEASYHAAAAKAIALAREVVRASYATGNRKWKI